MPKTVGHPYDSITAKLESAIMLAIQRSPTTDKPFNSVPISDDEQVKEYLAMSNNVNSWYNILKKQGLNGTMRYNAAMQKLLRKRQEAGNATTESQEVEQDVLD